MELSTIEVRMFGNGNIITYTVGHEASLHGGADTVLVRDFLSVIKGYKKTTSPIDVSIESHKI